MSSQLPTHPSHRHSDQWAAGKRQNWATRKPALQGPFLHQLHEDCRAGRGATKVGPQVLLVLWLRLWRGLDWPLGEQSVGADWWEGFCTSASHPFFALCSRHPPTKWRAGAEEPHGTLSSEGQGEQLCAGCLTNTNEPPAPPVARLPYHTDIPL